ncbi:DDB1- and CUL4-associated factor 17-like [Neocloeon triangulifer]|uniref:DDB1- and CUL4-associated factor 17-like n=1 Tax=Neocloeon triangulifer TaxID=2078957 RepID=UPI00286F5555|nr:DDB1- and CUL4-associated factor 17-like [Neocloeon triangulifer]XP_059474178.1 DDB1- and CUL4-associated factor 17-like [Neocloeon triangulifer]
MSLLHDLLDLQIGIGNKSVIRKREKIIKKLITSPCREFRSTDSIFNRGSNIFTFLHCGRLFRQKDKVVQCRSAYPKRIDSAKEVSFEHEQLYNFSYNFKCKDLVVWSPDSQISTERLVQLGEKHTTSIVYLKDSQFLVRQCCLSGKIKEKVFLSNTIKFNEMTTDSESDTIALKSTNMKDKSIKDPDAVFAIALFSSPPLRFVAMFEVKRSIFGDKIQDCGIGQGLIFIRYTDERVALYSLETILAESIQTKVEDMSKIERLRIGREPHGLPMNAVIKRKIPPLFEINTCQGELVIGSNPWYFITKTSPNELQLRSLDTKQLVTTVEFSRFFAGMEVEHMFFHPDDTAKVIHLRNNKLSIHHISKNGLQPFLTHVEEVPKCFTPSASANVTRSGRTVRKSLVAREALESQLLEEDGTLTHDLSISHDPESNIFAIFAITYVGPEQLKMLHVTLYDNATGQVLRRIPLDTVHNSCLFNVTCNLTLDGVNMLAEVRDRTCMHGTLLNLVENL